MMRRRAAGWLAALSLVVGVTACAQADGQGPDGPGAGGPFGADEAVILVEYTGGFVPIESIPTRLPIVAVYGDGRIITEGPVPAIYPGPALPNVQVQKISTGDVVRLAERALAAGVGSDFDYGSPTITDATSTKFTVLTDEGTAETSVYALAESDGADGLNQAQVNARKTLRDLLDALTNLEKTLGSGAVMDAQPYVPTAVAAIASPWTAPGDAGVPAPPERVWPGPDLPGDPLGKLGLNCLVAVGDDAAAVLREAAAATSITPWLSADERWSVRFRPLLPEETGCDDLVE
jgi:hypothetical protein